VGLAQLEAAVNEADKRDLIDPESLRSALENLAGRPGVAILRELLDRRTFRLTDSQLEREFLLRVRRVGFPPPDTQQKVNGLRRLLLARSRSRGGDRWTALSPDAGAAGEGPSA
jgi:hypothetical protein